MSAWPNANYSVYYYPLEDLFALDVMQPVVQFRDPLLDTLHGVLVRALNLTRLANRHVQLKPHIASRLAIRQVAVTMPSIRRGKANPVLAGIRSAECEAALGIALLRHDAVVVVKDFLDGNVHADVVVRDEAAHLLVPAPSFKVAYSSKLAS